MMYLTSRVLHEYPSVCFVTLFNSRCSLHLRTPGLTGVHSFVPTVLTVVQTDTPHPDSLDDRTRAFRAPPVNDTRTTPALRRDETCSLHWRHPHFFLLYVESTGGTRDLFSMCLYRFFSGEQGDPREVPHLIQVLHHTTVPYTCYWVDVLLHGSVRPNNR